MDAKPPTAYRLHERLFQIGALESRPGETGGLTAEEARDAIEAYCCEWAMCDRASSVDTKTVNPKCLTFSQYFEAVYGESLDGKKMKGAA